MSLSPFEKHKWHNRIKPLNELLTSSPTAWQRSNSRLQGIRAAIGFGHVKGGLCSRQTCEGKMAPVLEPHNSVCPKFCQSTISAGLGHQESEWWGYWISHERGSASQDWGTVGGLATIPESHNSVSPGSYQHYSRTELPRAHRVGLGDLLWGGDAIRFMGKWGEWLPPLSHITQSLTPPEFAQTSTTWPGSWLLSRAQPLQGGVPGSPEGRGIAFPRLILGGGECSPQERWLQVIRAATVYWLTWDTCANSMLWGD